MEKSRKLKSWRILSCPVGEKGQWFRGESDTWEAVYSWAFLTPGPYYTPGGRHISLSPQQIGPRKRVLLISFSPATALPLFSAIPHTWWVRLRVRREEGCWSGNSQPPGRRKEEGTGRLKPFCSSKSTAIWSTWVHSGCSWYLWSHSVRTTILSLALSAMIPRFCYMFWGSGVTATKDSRCDTF